MRCATSTSCTGPTAPPPPRTPASAPGRHCTDGTITSTPSLATPPTSVPPNGRRKGPTGATSAMGKQMTSNGVVFGAVSERIVEKDGWLRGISYSDDGSADKSKRRHEK